MMISRASFRFLVALALLCGFLGGQAAAQTTYPRYCSKSAFANFATTTPTQVAPNPNQYPFTASPTIGGVAPLTGLYICGYVLIVPAATTVTFSYGAVPATPGTGCGGTLTTLSIAYPAGTYLDMASVARGFEVPTGNVLCITSSTTTAGNVQVYYDNNPL